LCEEKASEIFLDRIVSFKRIIEYKNLYLQLKNKVSNKIKLLLKLTQNSTNKTYGRTIIFNIDYLSKLI